MTVRAIKTEHHVCQWIGNTEAVARAHYLQTTDEHFAKAVAGGEMPEPSVKSDAESDAVRRLAPQGVAQEWLQAANPSFHSPLCKCGIFNIYVRS